LFFLKHDEYDFEPPGRQERQDFESLIAFPGDPGVLAVDFLFF
jgi:hypothetical protein